MSAVQRALDPTGEHVGDLPLGGVIRMLREKRPGLSARQLSEAAGLSPAYVGKVESGTIDPSFRCFAKIARQLGMSAREVHALILSESKR